MKKAWKKVCDAASAIIKVYEFIELNFIVIFTMFIGAYIMWEIILRMFQIQGSRWIEEVSRYMLVVTTFMGSSVAVSQKGHMTMSALIKALPHKWSNVLEILTNGLGGVGFLYLSYASIRWTQKLMTTGKMFESVSFPMWTVWVLIDIAFVTTGIRYLAQVVKNVQAIQAGTYWATPDKEM